MQPEYLRGVCLPGVRCNGSITSDTMTNGRRQGDLYGLTKGRPVRMLIQGSVIRLSR